MAPNRPEHVLAFEPPPQRREEPWRRLNPRRDLEGYAKPLAARDRSLTEAAGLGEPPHLLWKLVAKSAELCEFVFEFEA